MFLPRQREEMEVVRHSVRSLVGNLSTPIRSMTGLTGDYINIPETEEIQMDAMELPTLVCSCSLHVRVAMVLSVAQRPPLPWRHDKLGDAPLFFLRSMVAGGQQEYTDQEYDWAARSVPEIEEIQMDAMELPTLVCSCSLLVKRPPLSWLRDKLGDAPVS